MSDRALNAEVYNWHRLSAINNLSVGWLWGYSYTNTMAASETDVLHFGIGDKPIALFQAIFSTTGTRGASLEFYVGGTVAGGTDVQGFPLNHHTPKAAPVTFIRDEAVVTVPGTLIGTTILGEQLSARGGVPIPLNIFAPQTEYYVEMTNLHNQAAEVTLEMDMGSIPGVIF